MKRKSDEPPWETADGAVRSAPHGQGMVMAVRSGVVFEDGIRETVEAGKTWILKGHRWLRDPTIAALFGLGGAEGRRAACELGEYLGLSTCTVLDRWERGELPGYRLFGRKGGPVRFRLSEIEALLAGWRSPALQPTLGASEAIAPARLEPPGARHQEVDPDA